MANKHTERLKSLPGWLPKGRRPKCQQCFRELSPVYEWGEADYDPFIDGHGPGVAVPTSRKVCREVRVKGWGYNGAVADQLTDMAMSLTIYGSTVAVSGWLLPAMLLAAGWLGGRSVRDGERL